MLRVRTNHRNPQEQIPLPELQERVYSWVWKAVKCSKIVRQSQPCAPVHQGLFWVLMLAAVRSTPVSVTIHGMPECHTGWCHSITMPTGLTTPLYLLPEGCVVGLAGLPGSLYINGSLSADWTASSLFSDWAQMADCSIFLTGYNEASARSNVSSFWAIIKY